MLMIERNWFHFNGFWLFCRKRKLRKRIWCIAFVNSQTLIGSWCKLNYYKYFTKQQNNVQSAMTISCSSCQSFSQLISQLTCCWSVSYVSQCNQLINQSTILPINLVRSNQNFLFYLCQGGLPVLTVPQGSHERVVLIVYIVSIRGCDMWFHGDCIWVFFS